jgi:hypothetical protein
MGLKKHSGKMFIYGNDEVIIPMKVRKPVHAEVFFIDHPIPCDGNRRDKVECKIVRHVGVAPHTAYNPGMAAMFGTSRLPDCTTDLVIKWHVGGVREIEYIYT